MKQISEEDLKQLYDYAGKDKCERCKRRKNLFVYRIKNIKLFEIDANNTVFYGNVIPLELKEAFKSNGHWLGSDATIRNGDRNEWLIRNSIHDDVVPLEIDHYDKYVVRRNNRKLRIYQREEQKLCAECILKTIQEHLDRSVDFKVVEEVPD